MNGKQILCNSRSLFLKRFFDLVFSILFLILLLPIYVAIAILIKFDSKGPIIFRQRRVGKDLIQFTILKFRTMVHVDDVISDVGSGLIKGDIKQSRLMYKTTSLNDTRVTAIGKFLRKSHLDELPQLINVFLGSMSLIGPRPDVPAQEYDYKNKYWIARHNMKPGITGFSQLYICNNNKERLARDIFYIKKSNMSLDLLILIRTVGKVLKFNSY